MGIVGTAFICAIFLCYELRRPVSNPNPLQTTTKTVPNATGTIPFAIDVSKGETDKYFGPPIPYDPNDLTMATMRQWMLGFAKAMDNSKHPCNPLITTNAKIVGINIKPLRNGDKRYTMWVSDGKTTCGMEAIHYTGWSGMSFTGDFSQRFYLRDLAAGFYYPNKEMIDAVAAPDKKHFLKKDIGEAAHDIVANALGQGFFDNTLTQEYSGFFVSDAFNAVYVDDKHQHYLFTKNVVDANLLRSDMPQIYPGNPANDKFSVYVQSEPSNSPLSFKIVYADAFNNGFDRSKMNSGSGQNNAVRLR
jgi:hypothetical protein